MIEKLKSFSANKYDMEELVVLSAYGKMVAAEFESLTIDKPAWLSEAQTGVAGEIRSRTADALKKKLTDAKARFETLKTPDQKRQDTQDEIKRLEAALGIGTSEGAKA